MTTRDALVREIEQHFAEYGGLSATTSEDTFKRRRAEWHERGNAILERCLTELRKPAVPFEVNCPNCGLPHEVEP